MRNWVRFLDPELAHVRWRAVFSARYHHDDDQTKELMGRPPRWHEDAIEEDLDGDHHLELPKGGDMTSAVLGIIKGTRSCTNTATLKLGL